MSKKKPLSNGLYHAYPPEFEPVMIDPNYKGFRIVYMKEKISTSGRTVNVITDSCEVKSMADGKTYTSKSQLKDSYKRHDVRIVEKGEYNPEKPQYGAKMDDSHFNCRKELKQAIQQVLGS